MDIDPHSGRFEWLREDARVGAVSAAMEDPEEHLAGRAPSRSAGP